MIYEYEGQPQTISLQPLSDHRYRVTLGEREIELAAVPLEDGWLLTLNGQQLRVFTAVQGGERWVSLAGESYRLSVPETRRRSASAHGGDLTAQMPGQVREVFVEAGAAVTSGQTLLILEAMKMEIRVRAPRDGQVKRLLVQVGEVVDRGQRLVEIE